jgi:hypothetical protein
VRDEGLGAGGAWEKGRAHRGRSGTAARGRAGATQAAGRRGRAMAAL